MWRDGCSRLNIENQSFSLTVNIINFEQELDLILWSLTSELMNRINEFLEGDGAAVIFVKNLEDSLHKERLQYII